MQRNISKQREKNLLLLGENFNVYPELSPFNKDTLHRRGAPEVTNFILKGKVEDSHKNFYMSIYNFRASGFTTNKFLTTLLQ